MMVSVNPYNQKKIYEVSELTSVEVNEAIEKADAAFRIWRNYSFAERSKLMQRVAGELRANKQAYAETITLEMGKPISQALSEIEKSASLCEYYAQHAAEQLANRTIISEAKESYVSHEPLGVIFAVMPWNYPLWQVFRFAVPALMAGNTGVLKHASNVMKSAA